MASGKAIGEFSLKMITATIVPGPAGSLLNQVNWEGTGVRRQNLLDKLASELREDLVHLS